MQAEAQAKQAKKEREAEAAKRKEAAKGTEAVKRVNNEDDISQDPETIGAASDQTEQQAKQMIEAPGIPGSTSEPIPTSISNTSSAASTSIPQTAARFGKSFMNNSFQAFAARLRGIMDPYQWSPTAPMVILVFDEAHTLVRPHNVTVPDMLDPRDAFGSLGHVLSSLRKESLYAVFLSTNTQARSLAPPMVLHPSARLGRAVENLTPPFTELPFDVFCRPQEYPTLESACSFGNIFQFGRTL